MAYAFNDDKTKVDINGLIAYMDTNVPGQADAGQSKFVQTNIHVPTGYSIIGVSVIKSPGGPKYQAEARYYDTLPTPIQVNIYNMDSTAASGAITLRVYMVKTDFLSVITD